MCERSFTLGQLHPGGIILSVCRLSLSRWLILDGLDGGEPTAEGHKLWRIKHRKNNAAELLQYFYCAFSVGDCTRILNTLVQWGQIAFIVDVFQLSVMD